MIIIWIIRRKWELRVISEDRDLLESNDSKDPKFRVIDSIGYRI